MLVFVVHAFFYSAKRCMHVFDCEINQTSGSLDNVLVVLSIIVLVVQSSLLFNNMTIDGVFCYSGSTLLWFMLM